MITKRKILAIFLSCLIVGNLMACSNLDKNPTEPQGPFLDTTIPSEDTPEIVHGTDYTDNTIIIQVTNEKILVNGQEIVQSQGDVFLTQSETGAKIINITKAGNYDISGQLSNGQILVDLGGNAGNNEKAIVNLYLNNITITNDTLSCIVFKHVYHNADTSSVGANIYTIGGTVNSMTCSQEGEYGYAIVSNTSLYINSYMGTMGVLNIQSAEKGIGVYNNLYVDGGNISVTSVKNCVEALKEPTSTITMNGGTVNVKTTGNEQAYGLCANSLVVINNGKVTAQSSNGFGIKAGEKIRFNGGTVQSTGTIFDSTLESYPICATFDFEEMCDAGTYTFKTPDNLVAFSCMTDVDFSYLLLTGDMLQPGDYHLSGSFGAEFMASNDDVEDFASVFTIHDTDNHFLMSAE